MSEQWEDLVPDNTRADDSGLDIVVADEPRKHSWRKPSATADICVFRRQEGALQMLLIRRASSPYAGSWALPGGFVEMGETIDAAAVRELAEETGIADILLEQMGSYSDPERDPRGWTITQAYIALADASVNPQAGDDAADARFFDIEVEDTSGGITTLAFYAGSEEVAVTFTARSQPISGRLRAEVLSQEGFAFDHAQIAADAYLMVSDVGMGLRGHSRSI